MPLTQTTETELFIRIKVCMRAKNMPLLVMMPRPTGVRSATEAYEDLASILKHSLFNPQDVTKKHETLETSKD
ncbi:2663_t:CDS:2 [Paraglomus brasilianum]|uniref:2663_t:CDS:1 n=1 Tax=Paraglomus brasilianum TaxID=144538 RepID=A0A9N9GLC5_9GLOM|nr:2663_t:CDS:2 [Paraglomus brasilianum]